MELGSGGFGRVDHVFSRLSLRPFARKRIPRGRSFKQDQAAIQMFENELATLKAMSHRHLVSVIGSCTGKKLVGLIMTLVTDFDLHRYLTASKNEFLDRTNHLRRFLGCLAAAVEYLHQHKVRHKGIKPQNILVKQGKVFLTDFGTSHSWPHHSHGTTLGTNRQACTKAYCAPEVAAHETRTTFADVWSLSCIYLELYTVLQDQTVQEKRTFFANNGTTGLYIRDNPEGTRLWIDHLRQLSAGSDDHQILHLITDMRTPVPQSRLSATEILRLILDFEGPMYYDICCDRTDEVTQSREPELIMTLDNIQLQSAKRETIGMGDFQHNLEPFKIKDERNKENAVWLSRLTTYRREIEMRCSLQ